MEFLTKLVETESTIKLREIGTPEDLHFREFERIDIGKNTQLSVQASKSHFCTPRKVVDLIDYTEMEVEIIRNRRFVNFWDISDDPVLITKIQRYYEKPMYKFVPVELIEELYQALKSEAGE